jgi:1,2-diacylglycerol 3-alpha-glucosyltransferase
MFTNTYAPTVGGTERSVATFAADLRGLGHEVLVVAPPTAGSREDDREILRIAPTEGVRLSGELRAFAPELVHAHQPFLLGELAATEAARGGLPLVLTHHTLYGREEDRLPLAALGSLEEAARELATAYSNQCDAVVAPTDSIAGLLRERGVVSPIEVVPTGIEVAKFCHGDGRAFRERLGIPPKSFVLGHLGRLVPAKRVAFLAEAAASFLRTDPDARALFCGEGEALVEIRACFASAGVADRLVLLGNLPDSEVADAYAAMDLFAFASLTDTQGIVLLEAMAAGVPVLALRATGASDLVVDGVCGRLLPERADPRDFAFAIAALRSNPNRPALALAARRRAEGFDRRLCADRLLAAYGRAVEKRCRGAPLVSEDALSVLQRRVADEWGRLRKDRPACRALLPTRGFPAE